MAQSDPISQSRLTIQRFGYKCDVCGKLFNWDDQSEWYGRWEPEEVQYVFCSEKCKAKRLK